jgi:cell division protein FtsQ
MVDPSVRTRRLAAIAVVAVIALAVAAWALTYTPVFAARHIRVQGIETLRPDAVRALAGVDGSTNVWHVDTEAIVGRLLSDPWIAAASVRRDLPDTLVLAVTERRPVAVVSAMGETSILASDATILQAAGGVPPDLPTMHAALGAPDDTQRQAAASLLTALDPVVEQRVTDVTVGQDGAVTLTLRDGVMVDAGAPGEETAKADALRAILRWAASGGRALTAVDVSAPSAPAATLADGSSVTP